MEFSKLTAVLLLVLAENLGVLRHHVVNAEHSARSTQDIAVLMNVTVDIIPHTPSGECYGGNAGLGDTALRLEFRSNASNFQWVEAASDIPIDAGLYNTTVRANCECVEFRLVQEEHGGGDCNCWRVGSVEVNRVAVDLHLVNSTEVQCCPYELCAGSASVPRGVGWVSENVDCEPRPVETLEKPFSTDCSQSNSRTIDVTFSLINNHSVCNKIDAFNEGVEFSIRFDTEVTWIPIVFLVPSKPEHQQPLLNYIGDMENLHLRDYAVTVQGISDVGLDPPHFIQICDFDERITSFQLRWLQTTFFSIDSPSDLPRIRDIWVIDDVEISYEGNSRIELLRDSFDGSELNLTNWSPGNIRNGRLSAQCSPNVQSLVFGLEDVNITEAVISRSVKTNHLTIATEQRTEGATPTPPPTDPSTTMATSKPQTVVEPDCLEAEVLVQQSEAVAGMMIVAHPELNEILRMEPEKAIVNLQTVLSEQDNIDGPVGIYLLVSILKRASNDKTTLPSEFESNLIAILRVANSIIVESQGNQVAPELRSIVKSSLVATMDDYLFNCFDYSGSLVVGNIGITVQSMLVLGQNEDLLTAIDSDQLPLAGSPPRMLVEIPQQILLDIDCPNLRLISAVYYEVEGLFPGCLPDTELGSGIVSTAIYCGTSNSPVAVQDLVMPVMITIEHSRIVRERLERGNGTVFCVFLEYLTEGSILSAGQLSQRGCTKNEVLSNTSVTVCECTHLTHFAILLSASPLSLSKSVTLSLEIIGYVGVAVSLVAMTLTVFTFSVLRSLHNIRSFIHINLCISLGVAQLTFIAGVGSTGDPVPIHCQVVAVLLHYLFLVSFMWMLMEGVVLYVLLIKVFVTNTRRYLIAFTLTSYGLPLLYLGLLTLPLGFALPTQPNYGYSTACYLNPETHFIWAFIAPVLVIMLANVAFLIMAAIVMWRHQKRQTSKINVKSWLKALLTLTVIMGLTWIFGVLIVEVEELIPLAYIYTILVAFQGVFIFILFVVLDKNVREAYAKKLKHSELFSSFFKSDTISTAIIFTPTHHNGFSPSKVATLDRKVEKVEKELREVN